MITMDELVRSGCMVQPGNKNKPVGLALGQVPFCALALNTMWALRDFRHPYPFSSNPHRLCQSAIASSG